MGAVLEGTTPATLLQAAAILGLLLAGLAIALFKLELGKTARRRRRLRQALAAAEHARRTAAQNAAEPGKLSPADLARLDAFRPRARLMAGEPTEPITWWTKVRLVWRGGYAGWIIAALVGAFSMATHFGAFWLIAGGGWLGAAVITILSTAVMVAACLWILLGLVAQH
ncbi:MAG: hypothetical protein ACRDI2_03400 [Chloroflexota bacterium]